MSYKRLKLKLRVFLAGHIAAMVTYCATKLTATCSPMIGQFIDTMMLASTGRVAVMTHQTLSLEKYWKLFPALSESANAKEYTKAKKQHNTIHKHIKRNKYT